MDNGTEYGTAAVRDGIDMWTILYRVRVSLFTFGRGSVARPLYRIYLKMSAYPQYETVQERLISFKSSHIDGKRAKWPHRRLSMISMARAFYFFDPTPEANDCVVCSCCGVRFSGWGSVHGKPICRHADTSIDCQVEQLARVARVLEVNMSGSCNYIKEVFQVTFREAAPEISQDSANVLAAQGFFLLPEGPTNKLTVGCLHCRCFPQNALKNPQHRAKCIVPSYITDKRPATVRSISVKVKKAVKGGKHDDQNPSKSVGGYKGGQNGARELVRPSTTQPEIQPEEPCPPAPSRACAHNHGCHTEPVYSRFPVDANVVQYGEQARSVDARAIETIDKRNTEASPLSVPAGYTKESVYTVTAEAAVRRCHDLFSRLKLGGERHRRKLEASASMRKLSAEELLRQMEALALTLLEEAHARRIQLINEETERVVSQLLKL